MRALRFLLCDDFGNITSVTPPSPFTVRGLSHITPSAPAQTSAETVHKDLCKKGGAFSSKPGHPLGARKLNRLLKLINHKTNKLALAGRLAVQSGRTSSSKLSSKCFMAFCGRSEGIWILLVSLGTRAITSKEWELLGGKEGEVVKDVKSTEPFHTERLIMGWSLIKVW